MDEMFWPWNHGLVLSLKSFSQSHLKCCNQPYFEVHMWPSNVFLEVLPRFSPRTVKFTSHFTLGSQQNSHLKQYLCQGHSMFTSLKTEFWSSDEQRSQDVANGDLLVGIVFIVDFILLMFMSFCPCMIVSAILVLKLYTLMFKVRFRRVIHNVKREFHDQPQK